MNAARNSYHETLTNSGHNLINQHTGDSRIPHQKKRKVIYFYLPFSNTKKTKLGKVFLKLVKIHFFDYTSLNKIFNKNTIKWSYSRLPNMNSIINAHNHKVLGTNNKQNSVTAKKAWYAHSIENACLKLCSKSLPLLEIKLKTGFVRKNFQI